MEPKSIKFDSKNNENKLGNHSTCTRNRPKSTIAVVYPAPRIFLGTPGDPPGSPRDPPGTRRVCSRVKLQSAISHFLRVRTSGRRL